MGNCMNPNWLDARPAAGNSDDERVLAWLWVGVTLGSVMLRTCHAPTHGQRGLRGLELKPGRFKPHSVSGARAGLSSHLPVCCLIAAPAVGKVRGFRRQPFAGTTRNAQSVAPGQLFNARLPNALRWWTALIYLANPIDEA